MNKWDLYDKDFKKTDKVIKENENILGNLYHFTLNLWIFNDKNEVLLFRNTLNNSLYYPGFWGCIAENVLSGETPSFTCQRCIKERIKQKDYKFQIKRIDTVLRDPYHYIYETYFVKIIGNIDSIQYDNSYSTSKWVNIIELKNMIDNGEISQVLIPRIEKYVFPLLK
jgi:isopentenyldiphosphate isomerase